MNFISTDDLKPFIKDVRLNQMLEAQTAILDYAESIAVNEVKDALYSRYDVTNIFDNPNDYPQVRRWVITLMLYFLHRRLPDQIVPPSVIKDYDDVREHIKAISDAKVSINLPHIKKSPDDPLLATKFRWGSKTPRSH
jgi:Protein of unknown function (DUF1320)